MCDDWDDSAVATFPSFNDQSRPIQSHTFGNSSYQSRNRGGNSRGRGFSNNSRFNDNRPNYQRNRGGFSNGNGGFANGNGGFGGGRNFRREYEVSDIINVPTKYVRRIIGRGGSKVQEMESDSGAKINVTREIQGDDTLVKICGDKQSVEKAKGLISEITNEQEITIVETKHVPPVENKEPEIIDFKTILADWEAAEAAEWAKYPPIIKDFYEEHPDVTAMSEEDVAIFRTENNNISVSRAFKTEKSLPVLKPCPKFIHAFHNYSEIMDEIANAGFEKPSPIQAQAWPILLTGEDMIGIAQTGTGKTLAFLLPALIHIDGQTLPREERGGPAVLIMAPTRELALQIDKEIKKYQYRGITSVCVYGGGDRKEQIRAVKAGVDIVIATPGRLNDLVACDHLNVKSVTYAVLDEADRMLDMGFEPQIRKVMYRIRPTRQTIMTSATWPSGVRRLAESYMKDPIQVYVGSLDLAAVHTVTQVVQIMPDDDEVKMQTFMEFAHNMSSDQKVIVFCGMKARADELSSELALARVKCQTLHGNRDQCDREQALIDITDGTVQILIATDVASRGLDIEDITHVVNYDFPRNIEEYVHRVGRTGRAGRTGESISYFTKGDWAQAKELISILEEAEQFVPDELYAMADRHNAWKEKKEKTNSGRGGRGGSRFSGSGGRRW